MIQQVQERVGERLMLSWPVKDLPLNIRPVRSTSWVLLHWEHVQHERDGAGTG